MKQFAKSLRRISRLQVVLLTSVRDNMLTGWLVPEYFVESEP